MDNFRKNAISLVEKLFQLIVSRHPLNGKWNFLQNIGLSHITKEIQVKTNI